ncbi:MAG: hypothetical protein ACOYVK_22265 [Bacillota bacterium]
MNPLDMTWHDLLIQKGIDPSSAKALISFISWNQNTEYPHLGERITNILASNAGSIFVKDAARRKHGDRGLLFLDRDLPDDVASDMFNIIIDYEEEEMYKM